jgi:flagellar protein FlgJ
MKPPVDTSSLGAFHDLNSLNNLKGKARESDEGRIEAMQNIAKQFESMFIGMMMKSMRDANAVFEEDNPLNSSESQFYRDMYDQQLSMHLSEGRGIGLADALMRQMSQQIPGMESLAKTNLSPSMVHKFGMEGESTDTSGKEAIPFNQDKPFSTVYLDANSGLPLKEKNSYISPTDPQQAIRMTQAVKAYMDRQQITTYAEDEAALKAGVERARQKTDGFDSPEEFVEVMWPVAQVAARKLNADPKALLAQSALETGWGKKIPSDDSGNSSFNLFGIKADSSWQGQSVEIATTEYRNGIAQKEQAAFRSYDSYVESMLDYTSFLQTRDHYQSALQQASSAEDYLNELQNAGYATDPKYANKIVRIMNGNLLKDLSGRADI